jgi:transcriptional regulator with XRE-family HTH domain
MFPIGKIIWLFRDCLEMNQSNLASKAGISTSYLCLIESGKRRASDDILLSCEIALNLPSLFLHHIVLKTKVSELPSKKHVELYKILVQMESCYRILKKEIGLVAEKSLTS